MQKRCAAWWSSSSRPISNTEVEVAGGLPVSRYRTPLFNFQLFFSDLFFSLFIFILRIFLPSLLELWSKKVTFTYPKCCLYRYSELVIRARRFGLDPSKLLTFFNFWRLFWCFAYILTSFILHWTICTESGWWWEGDTKRRLQRKFVTIFSTLFRHIESIDCWSKYWSCLYFVQAAAFDKPYYPISLRLLRVVSVLVEKYYRQT